MTTHIVPLLDKSAVRAADWSDDTSIIELTPELEAAVARARAKYLRPGSTPPGAPHERPTNNR